MALYCRTIFLMLLVIVLTSGCQKKEEFDHTPLYSEKSPLKKKMVYLFGVPPLHNPKRLFEVYQPMIEYINKHLEEGELRLEASRNYAAHDKKLFSGYFHFSLSNPYQTVISTQKGYRIFGKMGDDENFRGIILVRKDSGIKSVMDLKGKVISYPAPTALAAAMMTQWYLYKHGLNITKDVANSYVGSQESSIMNVYLGKSAAASTWLPPWRAFMKERPEIAKELMVKWETSSLPNNGLVARKDVPEALVQEVGNIFFSLHTHEAGKKILEAMELSKYERANDSTYDSVREFLKHFEREIRPIGVE